MDAIFKALNDPTRRAILDRLRARDGQTLQELEATEPGMTRFGVMKHLKVLEEAELVTTRRDGRFKHHYLNAAPLQEVIDRWIEPLLKPATRGLLDLKARLEDEMTKPDYVTSTYIRCTQDALWDALRSAEAAMAYDWLGQTVTRDGDALVFSTHDGHHTLTCRELEADPKSRLVTSFEPTWDAGTSRVVYLIEPRDGFCRLTVEHHGLTHPPEGGTADGWARTLAGLKSWLETGTTVRFAPTEAELQGA